jgi:hypothetical protein
MGNFPSFGEHQPRVFDRAFLRWRQYLQVVLTRIDWMSSTVDKSFEEADSVQLVHRLSPTDNRMPLPHARIDENQTARSQVRVSIHHRPYRVPFSSLQRFGAYSLLGSAVSRDRSGRWPECH